jgi:hypothetical protein
MVFCYLSGGFKTTYIPRTRAETARHGAVKLKYPAEKYKLNFNTKRPAQNLNYQSQRSYEAHNFEDCFNSSFSRNASVMRTYDTS